jgi:hypothetical protein
VGVDIHFKDRCEGCVVRAQCAPGKDGPILSVSPYYKELKERRAEQETEAFREKMKRRPAIEGTISELTRKHGIRRVRYRGKGKTRLQALFTGAAANLKRLLQALEIREQAPVGAKTRP